MSKVRFLLAVGSLLLAHCSSDTPEYQASHLTIANINEGNIAVFLYDGRGKEQLFSGSLQDLAKTGIAAAPANPGQKIFLIELSQATFLSIGGKEAVRLPEGTVWRTMLSQLPADNSAGFQINALTTLAAALAEQRFQGQGMTIRRAMDESYAQVAQALGIRDLHYDRPLDPFTKGAAASPALHYSLALLSLEEARRSLSLRCPKQDPWAVYFALLRHLLDDLSDGAIDGVQNGVALSFCDLPLSSEELTRAMLDGAGNALLAGNAFADTGAVPAFTPFFQRVSRQRQHLFQLPSNDSPTAGQPPRLFLKEPVAGTVLNGIVHILAIAEKQSAPIQQLAIAINGELLSDGEAKADVFEGWSDVSMAAGEKARLTLLARDADGNLSISFETFDLRPAPGGVAVQLAPPERTRLLDGYYVAKGNFTLTAKSLGRDPREILAFASDETRLQPDLQNDLQPDNHFYLAELHAQDLGIGATEAESSQAVILRALGVSATSSQEVLREIPVLIINHGPPVSLTLADEPAGRCQPRDGITVCDKARTITVQLKIQTYFQILSTEVTLLDSLGLRHPLTCDGATPTDLRCPFDPRHFQDGKSSIEVRVRESTGFTTALSYPLILDNNSLDRVVDLGTSDPNVTARPYEHSGPIVDLDRDGFPDLVTYGVAADGKPLLTIHWNDGHGQFPTQVKAHITNWEKMYGQVEACDLNGDSIPDLVVSMPYAQNETGQVGIYFGPFTRDGQAHDVATLREPLVKIGLRFGDFISCGPSMTYDVGDDLIVGYKNTETNSHYLHEVNKTLLFHPTFHWVWSWNINSFCSLPEETGNIGFFRAKLVGDVNGDGKNDLVGLVPMGMGVSAPINTARVFFGPIRRTCFPLWRECYCHADDIKKYNMGPIVGGGTDIRDIFPLKDFNSDGINDFAITLPRELPDAAGVVKVYYGNRSWNQSWLPPPALQLSQQSGRVWENKDFGSGGVAAGDFDGDGKMDLAVANKFTQAIALPGIANNVGLITIFGGSSFEDNSSGWRQLVYSPARHHNTFFGFRIEAFDLDRDGYSELFTSAPGAIQGAHTGIPYVFYKQKH